VRRKDAYDELAEEIVFGNGRFRAVLVEGDSDDGELAIALAQELRKRRIPVDAEPARKGK
jgi:hypothetical protein